MTLMLLFFITLTSFQLQGPNNKQINHIKVEEGNQNTMTNEEKALYQKYQELYEAMIKKDTAHLEEILDQDYHLIHMTGYDQTKSEWLDEINSENMRYFKQTEDKVSIDISGNKATIVSQNRVDARIYGSRHTWRLQLTHTLEKLDGEWIFTHTVAKTY